MKKLIYPLFIIALFSCNNSVEMKTFDAMIIEESVYLEDFGYSNSNFNITNIAQQKLQEYYDLSLLKEQHPKFENDIKLQLENLANTSIKLPKNTQTINISKVNLINNEILSDSTSKVQLQYQLSSEKETALDTISAIIKTKTIIINGEDIVSTKIKFENE